MKLFTAGFVADVHEKVALSDEAKARLRWSLMGGLTGLLGVTGARAFARAWAGYPKRALIDYAAPVIGAGIGLGVGELENRLMRAIRGRQAARRAESR